MAPRRETRDTGMNAMVGRHPDRKIAHSSMAKAVDFSCWKKNIMDGGDHHGRRKNPQRPPDS